jgi:hypothetical protein
MLPPFDIGRRRWRHDNSLAAFFSLVGWNFSD